MDFDGAEGRTRTDTELPLLDFESSASTNFTTPALQIVTLWNLDSNITSKTHNGALSET